MALIIPENLVVAGNTSAEYPYTTYLIELIYTYVLLYISSKIHPALKECLSKYLVQCSPLQTEMYFVGCGGGG